MGKTKDTRAAVEDELMFDPLVDSSGIQVANVGGDVAGVRNHLEVALPPGDKRDDPLLAAAANNALVLNITVPDGVEAVVRDGNVALAGTVRYGYQLTAAEATVAALTGVRNVKDEIEVSRDADPVDVTVAVQGALDRNALVPDDSDVAVGTDGSAVTLTGHVRTWAEHDAVLDAAWMTPAVYDVYDELVVAG